MRPEHSPAGDPCIKCGLPATSHRSRSRSRGSYFRNYDRASRDRGEYQKSYQKTYKRAKREYKFRARPIIGLDGEGFEHGSVYAFMSAWTTDGQVDQEENLQGLSTQECLEFILRLPGDALIFGFSLGYDWTQVLKDLSNEKIWKLHHIESRSRKKGPPIPVYYTAPDGETYALNLLSSRLTVSKVVPGAHVKGCGGLREDCYGCACRGTRVVWDCFKFFQASFVKACHQWGVISDEEKMSLEEMKKKRSEFKRPKNGAEPEWMKVKDYCGLECRKMAELAKRLMAAHEAAGLKLKAYFGAGSTGGAMLDKMKAREFMRLKDISLMSNKTTWRTLEYPPALTHAIACAFFGGRFEITRRGPVEEECWSYDISSAYPYAFSFLPCLVHGKWERVINPSAQQLADCHTAVVRYSLPWVKSLGRVTEGSCEKAPWGPFPLRNTEGAIIFPVTSGGGWLWRDEILAGLCHFPNVSIHEAWIYKTDCACKVFQLTMPGAYILRISWGKDGKGIVVKLGVNSCYGKCAQSKGANPPYQNFVYAGMTTSSCRGQVIHGIAKAPENVILVATDGIISTRRLQMDIPRDTGTFDCIDKGKKKPLGGWEEKQLKGGLHIIRPGIAFPLGEGVDEAETKARGIGKAILKNMRQQVIDTWALHGDRALSVNREMFFGSKAMVRKSPGGEFTRGKKYGRFDTQTVKVDYHPAPKRPCVVGSRLLTWGLGQDEISQPYAPALGREAVIAPHVKALMEEKEFLADQPDGEDEEKEF